MEYLKEVSSGQLYLQGMLTIIDSWCKNNLLTINCKKSQWMHSSLIKKNYDTSFSLGANKLDKVCEYKYLGLLIDSKLNFHNHRDLMQKRINYKMFFQKIRRYINTSTAIIIYKSTILPIIEYADFIYDRNIKYINKRFQTLQNQGLYIAYNQHILTCDMKESTETLHRNAKMYRLIHRRRLHLLCFAYDLTKNVDYLDIETYKQNNTKQNCLLFKKWITLSVHKIPCFVL